MEAAIQAEHSAPDTSAPAVATPQPGTIARLFGNTWAITKKELTLYFSTPLAYVILGLFVFAMGFFFNSYMGRFQAAVRDAAQWEQFKPGISERINFTDLVFIPLMGTAGILYVMKIPFLTMRLIAEEKKQNTFALLMTAPVRPWEIVFGKFISVTMVLTLGLALTATFPVLLNYVAASGGVEWQAVASVYLGYFLLIMAFGAIGLFISSMTESPIVAAIVTLFVLLVLYVFTLAGSNAEGINKDIIDYIAASTHMQGFLQGTVRLTDVSYFLSLTILGLVLTRTSIERERW